MRSNTALALAASLSSAQALYTGFNYGATFSDGYTVKVKSDYVSEFTTAQGLAGTAGTTGQFTSARLYTTIQGGSTSDPIEAIEAAIDTNTYLLLGLWASAGAADFANELAALSTAISTYGDDFTKLVIGISVGSEDLYRDSSTGQEADAGVGVGPDVITDYISQLRTLVSGTALSSTPVGHVDTWTAWVNGTNSAVIDAVDFLGFDGYPFFQNTESNSIDVGKQLFYDSVDATTAVAGGKPVWITETGWPVSGDAENLAIASVDNAKTYWDDVACSTIGTYNVFWYTLQDSDPTTPNPSFGLVGSTLSTTPLYDLTCPSGSNSTSSGAASVATSAAASVVTSATATVTGTVSGQAYTSTLVATSTIAGFNSSATGAAGSGTSSNGTSSSGSGPSGSDSSSGSSNGTSSSGSSSGSSGSSSSSSSSASSSSSVASTSGATTFGASIFGGVAALVAAIALL